MGKTENKKDKREKKRAFFKKFAAKVDEKSPASLNNLGAFFYSKGLYIDAIDSFQKALDLEPKYALSLKNFGQAVKKAIEENYDFAEESGGEMSFTYDDAIKIFKKALKIDPSMDDVYNSLGEIYYHRGMYDTALKLFKKAIEKNVNNALAHYNMSFLYGEKGFFDKAQEEYKTAVAINPNFAETKRITIDENAMAMYEEDKEILKKKRDPEKAQVANSMAQVFLSTNREKEAIEKLKEAIQLNPDFVEPYLNLGKIYIKKHKFQEAIEYFEKAVHLDSENDTILNNLGVLYHALKQDDRAAEYVNSPLQIIPPYDNT